MQESQFQQQELIFPADSPQSLEVIATFLRDKLGLQDIIIFDMRESRDSRTKAAAKISDFMIMATAKSGRHGHKSFIEVNTLLKQRFGTVGQVEGHTSANELRRRQKRLARHTNLSKSMGSRLATTRGGSNTESWYMIDCRLDNIFVNILTEKKRQEMNLEELYAPESEKHLYQRRVENIDALTIEEDDDNVLAGLKRLAARNQRRYYSSVPSTRQLTLSLSQQDFKAALEAVTTLNATPTDVLRVSLSALESFAHGAVIDSAQWEQFLNKVWPTTQDSQELWDLRFRFYKLLNFADPNAFGVDKVLRGYLQYKLACGAGLSKADLVEFLQLVVINLQDNPSSGYESLVDGNQSVKDALMLYKGVNPDIILDEQVMCLVLRTMSVSQEGKSSSLKALHPMIDFICAEYPHKVPTSVIATVLELLSQNKEYIKILKFWERGLKVPTLADYRPWPLFVEAVADSKNKDFIKKVINDGHLLWLKRNNIKVCLLYTSRCV